MACTLHFRSFLAIFCGGGSRFERARTAMAAMHADDRFAKWRALSQSRALDSSAIVDGVSLRHVV